jgi:alginate O-acetyltransferase complex protein AlgJ
VGENRARQSLPVLSFRYTKKAKTAYGLLKGVDTDLEKYVASLDAYLQDYFPYRGAVFNLYKDVQSDIFGENPIPKKVVQGNNGLLFLGDSYSDVILESKGINIFKEDEVKKIGDKILSNRTMLKSQGIDYYLAIAPNKHSIYGEYLPIIKSPNPTKIEQLKKYLDANSENLLIDMSDLLKVNKDTTLLFYKSDTHWNPSGAFWGYKRLMNALEKDRESLKSFELSDFMFYNKNSKGGDLSRMLGDKSSEYKFFAKHKHSTSEKMMSRMPVPENYSRKPEDYEKRYRSKANRLKIILFRDSFSTGLIDYLNENFGESVFIWNFGMFDKAIIDQEKPDIVVQEIVERDIDKLIKGKN